MNILIIGGAGYIGSTQTKMMLDNNYNVIVLDNLSTGFKRMIDQRAKFIKGDVRDLELVKQILNEYQIDLVMHFAALSLVGESTKKPLAYYNNNVYGFEILLQAMQECNVDKIIFSSTAAVYGNHDVMPITEEYETKPANPYGETKLAMEKMIYWASQAYPLNYVVLRYFNVAGASMDKTTGELHNPETHLIPLALEVALNKREYLSIYGDDYDTEDGTCYRDYIHVEDLCNAHLLAGQYLFDGNPSDTFNLGYSKGFSVKEIVESIKKVTKIDIKIKMEARRIGDPALLIASPLKAKEILKWKPCYDNIDTIIKSAYDFYLRQDELNDQ